MLPVPVFFILSLVVAFSTQEGTKDDGTLVDQKALPAGSSSMEVNMDVIMRDCNETFRTEMYYLTSLNESGTFPDEFDKTPTCFLNCLLEQSGVQSNGGFDAARAVMVFSRDRPAREMDDLMMTADSCVNRPFKGNKCDRAYALMKCLVETDLEKHEEPMQDVGGPQ